MSFNNTPPQPGSMRPHPYADLTQEVNEDDECLTQRTYYTDSGSDDEDDESSMVIKMSESIYSDIVVTVARGHIPEIMSSFVLTVFCVALQVLLSQQMAGQLAGDGAQLFGMNNITITDAPPAIAIFNGNSMFDIWSMADTKGEMCDLGAQKKWWACNQYSFSYEADAAGEMDNYFTINRWGQYQGFLFGGIALFLWMGYQVMELKSIMNYGQLLCLPSGAAAIENSRNACWPRGSALAQGKHYVYDRKEKCGRLLSLNLPGKMAVFLIIIARLFICVNLTRFGAMFLCYNGVLKDFILNSVALVFVYDIDELFFTVFLSTKKQRRISTLEPPQVYGVTREIHSWLSGTVGEFLGITLTVIVTYAFAQHYLIPYASAYYQAFYTMCGEPLGMEPYENTNFSEFACRDPDFNPEAVLRGPGAGGPPPGRGPGR